MDDSSSSSKKSYILLAAQPSGLFAPLACACQSVTRDAAQQEHSGGLCNLQREIACAPVRNCWLIHARSIVPYGVSAPVPVPG
jgi:hypothetical protein